MTRTEAEMLQQLAMSLDTCLDLVIAEARRERRTEAGKPLRNITWQGRAESFPKLVDEARELLSEEGHVVYF